MEKLEGCLSPKASQEKRLSPRRFQGRGTRARQERKAGVQAAGPVAPGGPASALECIPSRNCLSDASSEQPHSLPRSEFFFPPIVSPKRQWLSTNSPDSLITRPPDSTSDWFSYFQRKYDFQVSPIQVQKLEFQPHPGEHPRVAMLLKIS